MFHDAREDSLSVTLRAHKTVMGQLEKGELTLDSGWKEWDEVRKNSVLSQTLHIMSAINKSNNSRPQLNPRNSNNFRAISRQMNHSLVPSVCLLPKFIEINGSLMMAMVAKGICQIY